jgi:uncharacterized membrane protein
MRVICGIIMVVGSVLGMLVSFFSQITVNSDVSILNGMQLSMGLAIFFILSCLSGIYIIANSN